MIKKAAGLAIVLVGAHLLCAQAQNFKGKPPQPLAIFPPQETLEAGETLRYSIEWLGVPIATLEMVNQANVAFNGRQCFHITARTAPNNFFRRIYDAEYMIESYVDSQSMLPLRFQKSRTVKGVTTMMEIDFDQQKNQATYKYYSLQKGARVYNWVSKTHEYTADNSSVVSIPADCHDIFSALYLFRLVEVKPRESYPLSVCYDVKTWKMDVKVGAPFLKEVRKKGALTVFSAIPVSDLNNFLLGKRKVSVLFTADAKRVPLEFSLSTAVGALRGIIVD